MIKRLILPILLIAFALPATAEGQIGAASGWCEKGGVKVTTQGSKSTTVVQASYPQCQVTVYITGSTVPATIYADSGGSPRGNPFTANTDGSWTFYAATNIGYDIVLANGTGIPLPTPFTIPGVFTGGSGGGGGGGGNVNNSGTPTTGQIALWVNATTIQGVNQIAESLVTGLTTDLAAKAPLASPTFTGTVTLPVQGQTQCLHVDTNGILSGTGADCGAGGGGITGLTPGFLPTAATSSTLANSVIDYNVSNALAVTVNAANGLDITGTGGANLQGVEGTPSSGAGTYDILSASATPHRFVMNNNNTGAVALVGTSTTAATAGHCAQYASNGYDISDAGSACGSGGGGTTATPTSNSSIPFPATTTIRQALSNAANQIVHVTAFADSFGICDHTNCGVSGGPLVSTNRYLEQVRINLQNIYGSNGTGLVPLQYSSTTSAAINSEAWSCTGSPTTSSSLGPTQTGTTAGNTLIHMATGTSCTFSDARGITYTNFSLYYATPSTTSSLAITADGSTSLGTATSGSSAASGAAAGGLTSRRFDSGTTMAATTHSIVLACTGDCYLYAAAGVNGTTGVSVDNLGVVAANSNFFGSAVTTQLAFTDLIPGGSQAVIYEGETNDAAVGVTTGTFTTNLTNVITHEQALSSSPTIFMVIPPVDIVDGTFPFQPYTAIQQTLCVTYAVNCVNVQDRGAYVGTTYVGWGTAYNSASGLWDLTGTLWPTGAGGVHANDKGSLDIGQAAYGAIVGASGTAIAPANTRTTTATDTFVRANGALGANWAGSSHIVVTSNTAAPDGTAGNQFAWYTAIPKALNQYSKATVSTISVATGWASVSVRNLDASNSYFFLVFGTNGTGHRNLFKNVAGSLTSLAADNLKINSGDIIELDATGTNPTTLTAYVNGVAILTTTDSTAALQVPGWAGIAYDGGDTGNHITPWNTGFAPGASIVGRATCWKDSTHIGACYSVVASDGSCTCN